MAETLSSTDVETVFDAMCLAGTARGQTWLAAFLRHLQHRRTSGPWFQGADVVAASLQLVAQGRASGAEGKGYDVPPALREAWFVERLEPELAARALPAWARASNSSPPLSPFVHAPTLRSSDEATAYARLLLYAGLDEQAFEAHRLRSFNHDTRSSTVALAAMTPFMPARFERIDPVLRVTLLDEWLRQFRLDHPLWTPLLPWLDAQLEHAPEMLPPTARWALADWHLERGDAPQAARVLADLATPRAAALRAGTLAVQGRWAEAAEAFAQAHRALQEEHRARSGLLGSTVLRLYLLSLLAQPQPEAWTAARKLAVAEAGKRQPAPQG